MAACDYKISIDQGATFAMRLRLASATLDFSGSSTRGQIRRTVSDPSYIAAFECVNGSDGDGFFVDIRLSSEVTTAIPLNRASMSQKRKSQYVYDIEIELADGKVIRLIEGIAEISPEVTK